MKNIVLFGAGASFGSKNIIPESPVLGGDLFIKLVNLYPNTWGKIPQDYSSKFQEINFEVGMLSIMESGQHWIGPLMQDMALYFTSFYPNNTKNDSYSKFLNKLNARSLSNTLFSSLNYDCIFELAALHMGLNVNYNEISAQPNCVSIWKLHGSCNFIPDPKSITLRRSASYGFGAQFNPNLLQVSPYEAKQWILGDTALYPAMCMFTIGKPSQLSPHIFAAYQKKWAELVNNAEKLFVIGVRPHLADTHIWHPIAQSTSKLFFVGDKNQYNEWLPNRENRRSTFIASTLEEALEITCKELITD